MCWMCEHPGTTVDEWFREIEKTKSKHGWAVQYVESDRAPYAYTVGLHEHGLPELLVTGLPPQPTARLLNSVAAYLMDGGRPVPCELISITDGPILAVVQVEHPDAHMNVAVAFYGPELHALQLVRADDHGHGPWCPEFRNGGVRQPVFGIRPDLN